MSCSTFCSCQVFWGRSGVLGVVTKNIPLYGGEGGATEDGGLDEGSLLLRLLWLAGGKAEGGEVEDKFD